MSDLALYAANEKEWVAAYCRGESIEHLSERCGVPHEVLAGVVYAALDRRDLASVNVKRNRRIVQLEAVLEALLPNVADTKSAAVAVKTIAELSRLEGTYADAGAGPARGTAEPAAGEIDPVKLARLTAVLSARPIEDATVEAALAAAGWVRR